MTKAQAGRLGGRATVEKHGARHMAAIGRKGAEVTWERYTLKPISTSQYAMVEKETNRIVAIF